MVKWQDLIKYGGSSLVSLAFILAGILNLSGISYSDDGNQTCTDCFSEIKINSTYWEIKVESNGIDNPIIRKKTAYGRTLWLNLDRIDELVTTNPEVKVDILIPAISRTSDLRHEEYGYLRFLKDGDSLIHRTTQSNPSPSRIILHGNNVSTIVKWSFDMKSIYMEDIEIDPVWFGISIEKIEICNDEIVTVKSNNIYDDFIIYINSTICSDEPKNLTCSIETTQEIFSQRIGSYIDYINATTCKTIGLNISGNEFIWQKEGWECKRNLFKITCDAQFQSNKDGICQSGERCDIYDIRDIAKRDYNKVITSGYSPTPAIKSIRK